jgi:protein O-GlcNAc transferase
MKKIKIKSARRDKIFSGSEHQQKNSLTLSEYYYSLGYEFQTKGQIDKATSNYQRALQLNPNMVGAYYNLGTIFQSKKQLDEAVLCYKKALELDPRPADPYYNMGLAFQEQGRQAEALDAYDKALLYNPSFMPARWAKCIAQIPVIYLDASAVGASRANYRSELIKFRDTISLEAPQEIEAVAEAIGKQQPFFLAYQGLNDRELQQIYGDLVSKIMSLRYPHFAERLPMHSISQDEPLRVGIASGFFYYHAVWKIPIKGWIENLNKDRFRLYGYYTGQKKDKETDIARKCCCRFVENIFSFEQLSEIIRKDNLHILIYPEIGMDPTTLKLAALRLAPIQCTTWGHPDTSGLPTIDYFLGSDLMEPPDADDHYTEGLIRLPNLSIYYTPPEIRRTKLSRETFGFRPTSILYHCCQSLYKHSPENDDIFPRIARQVGDCQFLFVSYPNISSVVEQFRLRISQAFIRFNMKAEDYVVFLPPLPPDWYQALNCITDVYLDTPGWSGCNSILEALSCNMPVITLPSMFMRGREGYAILSMMGVTETIATTLDEYISHAVKLGKDVAYRQKISEQIEVAKHLVYRDMKCITALEYFFESLVPGTLQNKMDFSFWK